MNCDLFARIILYILSISERHLFFNKNACLCVPHHIASVNCSVKNAILLHIKLDGHQIDRKGQTVAQKIETLCYYT